MHFELFTAPGYPASGKVIWRHLYRYFISGENPYKIHSKLTGDMRQYRMTIAYVYMKHGVWQ